MAQYSHFRRTGTNLKTAGVSPQVAWFLIATMYLIRIQEVAAKFSSHSKNAGVEYT